MGLLELIIVILVIAWVLGSFVVPVGGSLINLLLVVVVFVVLIRVLQGRSL
ncbi:MAG TPA: lmo0937 family membrane protein [Gemmatimonadaceae bacterium]|nr:lmo0937 family membrane protein [Gemmatimonadaceae bacterium]